LDNDVGSNEASVVGELLVDGEALGDGAKKDSHVPNETPCLSPLLESNES